MKIHQKLKKAPVLFLVILLAFIPPWLVFQHIGSSKINAVSYRIARKASDQQSVVEKIVEWEHGNLRNLWNEEDPQPYLADLYYKTSEYPNVYLRRPDSWWVMLFRYGKCAEFAELFTEIANATDFGNFHARTVRNLGIDHVWNEAWVNGRWMHVDPSKKGGIINDPAYYERPRSENGMGENLWFVYAIDEEGNPHDVTANYVENSRLGELTVRVEKRGEPVGGAKVKIRRKDDPSPLFHTNENGISTFNLTGNENYTITAESDEIFDHYRLFAHYENRETVLIENQTKNQITLKFASPTGLKIGGISISDVRLLALLILVILFAHILYGKKREKSSLGGSQKFGLLNREDVLTDFLDAFFVIISIFFLIPGLLFWKSLWICFGFILLGLGLAGIISSINPELESNNRLLVSGVIMIIATIVCIFMAYISAPANPSWSFFWLTGALLGLFSVLMIIWKRMFFPTLFGTIGMAITGIVIWFPIIAFSSLPVYSIVVSSLISTIFTALSRDDFC